MNMLVMIKGFGFGMGGSSLSMRYDLNGNFNFFDEFGWRLIDMFYILDNEGFFLILLSVELSLVSL